MYLKNLAHLILAFNYFWYTALLKVINCKVTQWPKKFRLHHWTFCNSATERRGKHCKCGYKMKGK